MRKRLLVVGAVLSVAATVLAGVAVALGGHAWLDAAIVCAAGAIGAALLHVSWARFDLPLLGERSLRRGPRTGAAVVGPEPGRTEAFTVRPGLVEGRTEGRSGPPAWRAWLRWGGVAALAALCAIALWRLDLAEVARSIAAADVRFLAVAVFADLFSLAAQAGRWLALVHPADPRARARDAFFALNAGFAIGLVVPARASDLARAHLLSRRSGGSTATYAATAVVDHLLGSVALFGALGAAALLAPLPRAISVAGTIACVISFAGLVALWVLRPRHTPVGRPDASAAAAARLHAPAFLRRLQEGLRAVGRPRALVTSLLFAVVGWSFEVLIAHLALRAFGLPAGVGPSLVVVLATTVAAAASVSPGNAGAFELACVIALSGFDVGREAALAFAIGYHAVHLVPTATIGGAWLAVHGTRGGFAREAR